MPQHGDRLAENERGQVPARRVAPGLTLLGRVYARKPHFVFFVGSIDDRDRVPVRHADHAGVKLGGGCAGSGEEKRRRQGRDEGWKMTGETVEADMQAACHHVFAVTCRTLPTHLPAQLSLLPD